MIIKTPTRIEVEGVQQGKSNSGSENFCLCLIGTNRTGKSVTAEEIGQNYKADNPNNEVMAFDPQDRFSNIATSYLFMHDKNWCKKALELRNGLLILDDYRLLHKKSQASDDIAELIYFRAKRNVDIIIICHNPALILNFLTYFISHYYIFYTQSQDGAFEKKIPNYMLCKAGSDYINDYVKVMGRGEYPKFPHVIIDTEKQEIFAQNINHNEYLRVKETLTRKPKQIHGTAQK